MIFGFQLLDFFHFSVYLNSGKVCTCHFPDFKFPRRKRSNMVFFIVGQIGVKNRNDTAFCDEELKFGKVIEKVTKRGFYAFSYSLAIE